MISEGRNVDDYIFTSTNEQSAPYIEWNNPEADRSINRCASLATNTHFKLTPRNCPRQMKYICEFEGSYFYILSALTWKYYGAISWRDFLCLVTGKV